MTIKIDTWIILTKEYPLRFGTRTGELTELFEKAFFHSSEESAKVELNKYDDPDDFKIRKVSGFFDL